MTLKEPKNKKRSLLPITLTALFSVGLGVTAGLLVYHYILLSYDERKLLDSYRILRDDWLYGNEELYLGDDSIAGMVNGPADSMSDSYTFYTSTYEGQNLSTNYTGGFGFSSRYYDGGLYVTEIHDESGSDPAPSKGKLYIGDVLYGCYRGKSSTGSLESTYFDFRDYTLSEINAYIQDEDYDLYSFRVLRSGSYIDSPTIQKGSFSTKLISVNQTPTSENNFTAVIKINTFLGAPQSSVYTQVSEMLKTSKINTLVFDLRGNGGGYVNAASSMASLFVKKGTLIYSSVNKNGQTVDEVYQTSDPVFADQIGQYRIITDGNSASASELFALAMRSGADATVYGFTSYGKGISQQLKTYSDGSTLRYTSAYVYGPKRENETLVQDEDIPFTYSDRICIHDTGITPDQVYNYDYQGYQTAYDYTTSLAISVSGMNHFLATINALYPTYDLPTSYSADYHFTDAVLDYTDILNEVYNDDERYPFSAFDESGCVSRDVNSKFNKDTYDAYLSYYADLTKESIA